jgi:hypothetical protein
MTGRANRRLSVRAIFGWPLAILLSGLAGLVIALTGDGWRDAAAWVALAVPVAAVAWAMKTRRS